MGYLAEGEWHRGWYDTARTGGRFERSQSGFRNWISSEPGAAHPPEAGRYHLYVSHACPWSHRTTLLRRLKKLDGIIGLSVTDPLMDEDGWQFSDAPGAIPDTVNRVTRLYELYLLADPDYSGRVTVPVLWDKVKGTIVSNESADIVRMFESAFDGLSQEIATACPDLYPEALRDEIDGLNAVIYDHVNNGVYKCGFATTQDAYEEAFRPLFATLDELEARLSRHRYLIGNRLTEADWRLFVTLVRFDPVYALHFKCNRDRIADLPNLFNYLKDLYQVEGVAGTVDFDHIKQHYYRSHTTINPTGIVPLGPRIALAAPHDRDRFGN
jgi:putative glutathione S-transferase